MNHINTVYIRKCVQWKFIEGQDKVDLNEKMYRQALYSDAYFYSSLIEIGPITEDNVEKYPDLRWDDAYVDFIVGTYSSVEDKYGRITEIYFEWNPDFDEDIRELFYDITFKERNELSKMTIPDFFIPYLFELPDHDLAKVKSFRVKFNQNEDEDGDFYIASRKEQEDDEDLREITKDARKIIPLAFYSAHRLNIRAKRDEPIFVFDENNSIIYDAEEIKASLLDGPDIFNIMKSKNLKSTYFQDGDFKIYDFNENHKFIHIIFNSEDDKSISIDMYCKINGKGFIVSGSMAYGCIRGENLTAQFEVDSTGFMRSSHEYAQHNFWWTNIYGCQMKVGERCAVWTKNFKKSCGFILSSIES